MVPVLPDKVKSVEFVPAQTLADAGKTDPATVTGLTLITTLVVLTDGHTPLVTTAR